MPARPSRLAVRHVLVVQIAQLSHRRHAINAELAHFARRQLHQREIAFLAHQLRRAACRPHYLSALARIKLQIVNHRAGRNVANLQRIARQNFRARAVLHRHAHFQAHRLQNVALLAIRIMQQGNARRTVRVVFDRRHFRGNPGLLAPEIHVAVFLLVPAAAMPGGHFAVRISSAGALLHFHQRFFRCLLGDLALIEHGQKAS